jgi:hypothetical protein
MTSRTRSQINLFAIHGMSKIPVGEGRGSGQSIEWGLTGGSLLWSQSV